MGKETGTSASLERFLDVEEERIKFWPRLVCGVTVVNIDVKGVQRAASASGSNGAASCFN